jgi:hypothetical protein
MDRRSKRSNSGGRGEVPRAAAKNLKGVLVLNSRQLLRNGSALVFLLLTTLLAACSGGQTESTTICSAETLGAAANLSPSDVVLDASKPVTLSWTYSNPACTPDHYEVTLGTSTDSSTPGSTQTSTSTAMNWPGTLTQGTTYFWAVYPVVDNNGQAVRGPGQTAYFYTGPVCAADATLTAPVAIFPSEGTSLDPSAGVTLRWDDPMNCVPDGNYYVEVSKLADFTSVVYADQNGRLTELALSTTWAQDATQDCTKYYWRVQTQPSGSVAGPWSSTASFLLNKVGSACPLIEASPTPTATLAPLPTDTPIPTIQIIQVPVLEANENVNCRRGPSAEYDNLDTLFRGWSSRIYGRNEESTWWYINSPNIAPKYYCWVWGGSVTITGDTSQVPVVVPPPPPTVTPEPTNTPGG